jgi:alpha-L-arabinofuranosidase
MKNFPLQSVSHRTPNQVGNLSITLPRGCRLKAAFPFAEGILVRWRHLGCLLAAATVSLASAASITVQTDQPQHPVSPAMWGLFFEDINYAADGGLYAELVQNRSFEHQDKMYSWFEVKRGGTGRMEIASDRGVHPNNPNFLRLHVSAAGYGVGNSGFGGIAVQARSKYWFAAQVRASAEFRGDILVRLEDEAGLNIGEARLRRVGPEWQRLEATLTSKATTAKARLVLVPTAPGTVDLDVVSLFPQDTFKGRRNGLRKDLAQLLADIKPGSFRFPGGCIVEGTDFANMYRWKDTVGEIWERKQNWNLWRNAESPQYHQTYGLGFFEYFQFCADIGAEPVPILNCGMCCQARGGRHVPLDQLQPYIQDALDLIEFANGPVTSQWGGLRARMGHPKPFNLKYLGIGNEQWNQEYFDRYEPFYHAIKAKHPEIQIISTSGPGPSDDLYHFAWNKFRSGTPADLVDEHYYRPPQWFLENVDRYDHYDRNGPKVYAGEYAAHDGNRRNNLRSAIAEAAFMTGLLKNADVVEMAAYAPLFAKEGHVQWRPDLIWFDNTRVYPSPSYHVQALYGQNRPDVTLPVQVVAPMTYATEFKGRIGVGTWRTQAEFKDIKVTRDGTTLFASDFSSGFTGWETHGGTWSVVDGALRQTSDAENVRAFIGDKAWGDYTLTLKARKISGAEGFLISFANPAADTVTWWNIAGWNNTQHGLEIGGVTVPQVRGQVETGVWYDIRIELKGASVKCYLNDRLIQEAAARPIPALYATAGRDQRRGETVIAVANPSQHPQTTRLHLAGAKKVAGKAQVTVLTGLGPDAENSFANPTEVAPQPKTLTVRGAEFEHQFPPWSLTILRLKTN